MNAKLRAVYYCATADRTWGKGLTIADAKKNAGMRGRDKKKKYAVWGAMFNDPTDAELENLRKCITADDFYGSPKFYDHNRTEEDDKMINDKLVGWIIVEENDSLVIKP